MNGKIEGIRIESSEVGRGCAQALDMEFKDELVKAGLPLTLVSRSERRGLDRWRDAAPDIAITIVASGGGTVLATYAIRMIDFLFSKLRERNEEPPISVMLPGGLKPATGGRVKTGQWL